MEGFPNDDTGVQTRKSLKFAFLAPELLPRALQLPGRAIRPFICIARIQLVSQPHLIIIFT